MPVATISDVSTSATAPSVIDPTWVLLPGARAPHLNVPVVTTPRAVPIEVSVAAPAVVAMPWKQLSNGAGSRNEAKKRSVEVKRILADFRVNLTVSAEDYNEAVEAGAIFDEVNGVLFVSPRTDLLPVRKWLPFSLDGRMQSVFKVSDDYGILAFNPSIPRAVGPTKVDGSPDTSHLENIRVAEMLGLKSEEVPTTKVVLEPKLGSAQALHEDLAPAASTTCERSHP